MTVDSFAFLDPASRIVMKAWIRRDRAVRRAIPWTPLPRPLAACRVALLTSAGIALRTDRPFDRQGERENPWWGDPTHRILPAGTTAPQCRVDHLHIDPRAPAEDLNVCLPLDRAAELAAAGTIGSLAESHYSIMGYQLDTGPLLEQTVPRIVERLRREEVGVLLLVPV